MKSYPLFITALTVIVGVLIAPMIPWVAAAITGIIGFLILAGYYFFSKFTVSESWEKGTDFIVLLLGLTGGILLAHIHTSELQKQVLPLKIPGEVRLCGEVISKPNVHPNYTSFRIKMFLRIS